MKPERADWRPNPVTEREIAEDRRRERRRRKNVALLAGTGLGLCPLSCLGTCTTLDGHGDEATFMILGLVSAVLGLYGFIRFVADKEAERRRVLALRQEFSGVGGWLVEMTVFQGEAVSGTDVGVVWFEKERLFFTGARTSFGLGVEDTARRVLGSGAVIDSGIGIVLPLREWTPVGAVAIGLRFIAHEPEISPVVGETSFRHTLGNWMARSAPTRGQLPPLTPGPDLPAFAWLGRRAWLATLVWPAVGVLALLVGLTSVEPAIAFLAMSLGFAFWAPARSPRRAWRAVRDRQALEAYNRD